MKTRIQFQNLATAAALALALASAALSVRMVLADETVGTFQEGLEVGNRNGGLIAARVHNKVLGRQGCLGLERFQDALGFVAARVRNPYARGTSFTAGFYQGYLAALGQAVRDARAQCAQSRFDDGLFAGALAANIYCQVAFDDADALAAMSFSPLYDSWSVDQAALDGCAAAFSTAASECGLTGIAAQLLGAAQAAACADTAREQR